MDPHIAPISLSISTCIRRAQGRRDIPTAEDGSQSKYYKMFNKWLLRCMAGKEMHSACLLGLKETHSEIW